MSHDRITVTIDADLKDLIPGFMENRRQDVSRLTAAMADSDLETLRSIGHSLKGVGGGYGFMAITEIGAAIEAAARSGEISALRQHIDALSDYLQHVDIRYE